MGFEGFGEGSGFEGMLAPVDGAGTGAHFQWRDSPTHLYCFRTLLTIP